MRVALGFSDARLLLFPVKSMRGIFAWVTCPAVLNRYFQDLDSLRQTQGTVIRLDKDTPKVPNNCGLFIGKDKKKLILEEYSFDADNADKLVTELADRLANLLFKDDTYRQAKLKTDLVVLPDNAFSDFVTLSTEVITRTKINNETGTVQTGALFTEEFLPAESVLYSLVLSGPLFMKDKLLQAKHKEFADFLDEKNKPNAAKTGDLFKLFMDKTPLFQLGGDASLGKGIVKAVFDKKDEKKEKQA